VIFTRHKSIRLSVVVIFFDMRREAERTLYSLSRSYQELDADFCYEVLAIDHGSSEPLSSSQVRAFGPEFSHFQLAAESPSPCRAINQFVARSRYENIVILIDGARMLSPGVLRLTETALKAFAHPFVYTIGLHLGPQPQNYSVSEGYDSSEEDRLLESVNWKTNGYSLFQISSPGLSSKRGFFSEIAESNCIGLRKQDFLKLRGYRTEFHSPGGGLCNHDLFNRVHESHEMQPILLLGEGSFHQFHGGVSTNIPIHEHPWDAMENEYTQIVGERWRNKFRPPVYLGSFRQECANLYNPILPEQT
jgi:hypothetical protein